MPAAAERRVLDVTVAVVTAYVAHNHLPPGTVPELIAAVHGALKPLAAGRIRGASPARRPTAAEIQRSITPDALVSFIDGRPYKVLRRHLTRHGLSPSAYRERYGLPNDYPMVAPAYGLERSRIAKAIGLGVPHGR